MPLTSSTQTLHADGLATQPFQAVSFAKRPWLMVCLVSLWTATASGYESDQYLYRDHPVDDALVLMDGRVNDALQSIAADWEGERSEARFAQEVYYALGGWYWVDRIERWADTNAAVQKYPQTRYHHIYRGMPIWATRVNWLFGVGRSMRVSGVMLGTDKFGHFFSQGLKYHKRFARGWAEEKVLRRGVFAERWLFGLLTTGVYANADLVANYEGMRFYRSLSEPNIIPGKNAIVMWDGNTPRIARAFSFADHINDYWDEALNPSLVVPSLGKRLKVRIGELCDAVHLHPELYSSKDDQRLWDRYQHIGLRDGRELSFERVCGVDPGI